MTESNSQQTLAEVPLGALPSEPTAAPPAPTLPESIFNFGDFTQAWEAAQTVAKTSLIPAAYRGKPESVLVVWQFGAELGIPPMQSLQCIADINGHTGIYGDSGLALVQAHPSFEDMQESVREDESGMLIASCTVKRVGRSAVTKEFSQADAITAGIWGRNVHKAYPKDMLLWRARWRALRATFSDVLRGMHTVEELQERPPEREISGEVITPNRETHSLPDAPPLSRSDEVLERARAGNSLSDFQNRISASTDESALKQVGQDVSEALEQTLISEEQAEQLRSQWEARRAELRGPADD